MISFEELSGKISELYFQVLEEYPPELFFYQDESDDKSFKERSSVYQSRLLELLIANGWTLEAYEEAEKKEWEEFYALLASRPVEDLSDIKIIHMDDDEPDDLD